MALIVLDGWGQAPQGYPDEHNAIARANLPTWRGLMEKYPHTLVRTSGLDVGLPKGVMGNSEVGHTNLGAGRVVYQDLVRIDAAVEKDDFRSVESIIAAMNLAKQKKVRIHLMGLTSDGSVHSCDRHYLALMRLAKDCGITGNQLVVHAFTDGRDTPPREGINHITRIQNQMQETGCGIIGTVSGRYYAMDRDTRWDRTKLAYDAMVLNHGPIADSAIQVVNDAYAHDVTDEFIVPTIIRQADGTMPPSIEPGDVVICFNYRADRVRQICHALTAEDFSEFPAKKLDIHLVTMTLYKRDLPAQVAFAQQPMTNSLGELFSKLGKTQLRIAETEKYPHVSFFFSCGREAPFDGEHRVLIPSARDVPTYDFKPEMSAPEIAQALVKEIQSPNYDLIVNNFANADMVGHTGNMQATIKACEAVDDALTKVLAEVRRQGGTAIITADHGNAEQLWDFDSQSPQTQHTTNPVPLIIVDEALEGTKLREEGRLADVAPTILELLSLTKPEEMSGISLLTP